MVQAHHLQFVIQGAGKTWEFPIPIGRTIIGRQPGCDLLLENPQISRQHAHLDCTLESLQITDLNSSNGTILNGQRLTPEVSTPLKPGDCLEIGPFTLMVNLVAGQAVSDSSQPETRASAPSPKPDTPPRSAAPGRTSKGQPPPPKSPPPHAITPEDKQPEWFVPPGLSTHSQVLINYLPDIYHSDFMSRFLALFESIHTPIDWIVDHFDLFLSPGTAPDAYLPWLAGWFQIPFDNTWSSSQKRQLINEAQHLYARRGTSWALSRVLEIYTGVGPEIIDTGDDLPPYTFIVNLPLEQAEFDPNLVRAIIERHKPAHTTYELNFRPGRKT